MLSRIERARYKLQTVTVRNSSNIADIVLGIFSFWFSSLLQFEAVHKNKSEPESKGFRWGKDYIFYLNKPSASYSYLFIRKMFVRKSRESKRSKLGAKLSRARTKEEKSLIPSKLKSLPFRRSRPVLPSVKKKKFEMVVNGYLRDGRRTRN